MDFGDAVARFAISANENIEETVKGTSIKLFSNIIKESPVLDGRLKSNWQVSGAIPASGEVRTGDKSGSRTLASTERKVIGMANWQEITLTNNLPYAETIEYGNYGGGSANGPDTINGFSKQAPSGLVRVNVRRFSVLLNAEARRNR